MQQTKRIVFVEHVNAVADALRVTEVDGLANMEAQARRRHHARRKFTRVQRDVDLRINRVQVVEHLHLQVVVAHGDVAVLRHHEVDADDVGIGARDLEAEQRLREDLLRRKAAEHLIEEVNLDVAGRRGVVRPIAVLDAVADVERMRQLATIDRNLIAQTGGDQLVAKRRRAVPE